MSRLPTLSTPGRPSINTPPHSGLPTPTGRRPRSSLGPSSSAHLNAGNEEMDLALQEVLKRRPPSSLKNKSDDNDDPDTPTHPSVPAPTNLRASMGAHLGVGAAPRTPGARPKTPSTLATPSASRAVSRSSNVSRPGITGTNTFTPRRTSMASSTTSSTPYAKRPESRASMAGTVEEKFAPVIGDKVRMQSMGMEGTLRYVGETEFKAGVWAGVESEGGFAGKGKNDGSVNGVPYFSCPPNCGVFVIYANLRPPTAGISRPASVASSHRSLATSHASYSLSGRMTPSSRPRPSTATPGRTTTRNVSTSVRSGSADDDNRPAKTLLGTSTSSNAAFAAGKITAGSRASKYVGMTAKQSDSARAGTTSNASVRNSRESTTTTPKASRVSMGGATPVRPRQSIGGNFVTPKPRVPRASQAADMMPPPPSPSNLGRTLHAQQTQLEEEIRELRKRNAALEEESKTIPTGSAAEGQEEERQRIEALQAEVDRITEEAETLRSQLSASQAEAADASKLAQELQNNGQSAIDQLAEKERESAASRREMEIAAERAQSESDAGMDAKREEVRNSLERAEIAESEGAEMRALVEELTQAGQATISLYETKQYDLEDKVRTLEEKSRSLEEKLAKAREEQSNASADLARREATTAAEIDNETLTAQSKHLQHRLNNLEEDLEETRAQAEADAESWKGRLTKAKDAERAVLDRERELKEEVRRLQKAAEGAKARIAESESALKENNGASEAARAEIESLRGDAAEASSMRAALQDAVAKEKVSVERTAEVETLTAKLQQAEDGVARLQDVEAAKVQSENKNVESESKIGHLETEISTLRTSAQSSSPSRSPGSPFSTGRKGRSSNGSSDDDSKKIVGFQHIISESSSENAELKERCQHLAEEVSLLKEEVKSLEETNELDGQAAGSSKELLEAKAAVKAHAQTIKELNEEVLESESLIESKIYREDELETRSGELERELAKQRAATANGNASAHDSVARSGASSHSRQASTATVHSTATEGRCELCEGPHDSDACPVFAGKMDGEEGASPSAGKQKRGKWCADCESPDHDTIDCPMAEDVF